MPLKFSFRNKAFLNMKKELLRKYPFSSSELRQNRVRGLVSVVLPVYNCEKYLEEAIMSVLSQTYTKIELIIVDDGSEDASGRIADEFIKKDDRVKVIHQKNLKLPTALNNGFSVATGEFLTWTSADNRMLPVCIEILAAELSRDRDCDMVFGNMRLIDENGKPLRGRGWYEEPPFSGNVILPDSTHRLNTVANNTIGAAFLYRSGAAAILGGYSQYKFLLEDYDWFMRMNSLLTIKHTLHKKPIYEYRMHKDSLTAKDRELGITASRPALMELDRHRRKFYTKTLSFYSDGEDKKTEALLSARGRRIYSASMADKLASSMNIFYINFGNVAPSWEAPEGVPRFLVSDSCIDGIYGYDVLLCKNSVSLENHREWLCPADTRAMASFIFLRAKNDIMYSFEKKFYGKQG